MNEHDGIIVPNGISMKTNHLTYFPYKEFKIEIYLKNFTSQGNEFLL